MSGHDDPTDPAEGDARASSDLTDEELDLLGQRAGEALRRDAPASGPDAIRRGAARRRTSTRTALGVIAATAITATVFAATGGDDVVVPVVDPTTLPPPVTSLPNPTTSTTPPTTPGPDSQEAAQRAPLPVGEAIGVATVAGEVGGLGFRSGREAIGVLTGDTLRIFGVTVAGETDSIPCPVDDADDRASVDLDAAARWAEVAPTLTLDVIAGAPACDLVASPDGRYLAASRLLASDDASGIEVYTTTIYSATTGDAIGEVAGRRPSFSASTGTMVTSAFEAVTVWDPATASEIERVDTTTSTYRLAAFDPTGRVLVAWGNTGLRTWDAASLAPGAIAFSRRAYSARLDPTGTRLAVANSDGFTVWDVATGAQLLGVGFAADLSGIGGAPYECGDGGEGLCRGGEVFDVLWSPDGTRLLTNGVEDAVRLYDATTGTEIGPIRSCFEGMPRQRLATWVDDHTVVVAHRDGCMETVAVTGSPRSPAPLPAFGRVLASRTLEGAVNALTVDLVTGTVIASVPTGLVAFDPSALGESLAVACPSPTGLGVANAGMPDELVGHLSRAEEMTRALYIYDVTICDISVSSDGAYLVERGDSFTTSPTFVDLASGRTVDRAELGDDWQRRFSRTPPGARSWQMTTGRAGLTVQAADTGETAVHTSVVQAYSARLDPAGERVAAATFTGVAVWDLSAGSEPTVLVENGQRGPILACVGGGSCLGGEILDVHWSPDGTRLLTDGTEDAVHVIDATTGQVLGRVASCVDKYRLSGWIDDRTIVVADGAGCIEVIRLP